MADPVLDIEALREAADTATDFLRTLANPDRLMLLCQLSNGERCVSDLENTTGIPQPTLSQRLPVGMIAAPSIWLLFTALPAAQIDADYPLLIIAGLLVGVGTRYGSGCTSGHGVCGLSRLSLRSLVATLAFMAAGFVTVFIARHLIGGF